jgi:predicted nucleic acid-binding protein
VNAFLLDTSALLAHWRNEAGAERVQAVLDDADNEVQICSLSVTELARRLKALGAEDAEARGTALQYAGLADKVISIDTAVALRAFELGAAGSARLPLADALIAASAAVSGATLVHRDPHFEGLGSGFVSCERL